MIWYIFSQFDILDDYKKLVTKENDKLQIFKVAEVEVYRRFMSCGHSQKDVSDYDNLES